MASEERPTTPAAPTRAAGSEEGSQPTQSFSARPPDAPVGPSTSGSPGPSTSAATCSTQWGLDFWLAQRRTWLQPTREMKELKRYSVISPSATYDDLLLSSDSFDEPVSLPEMVEFLVDAWIQDGLYD